MKVRCQKCGERNDKDNTECFYCGDKIVTPIKSKKDDNKKERFFSAMKTAGSILITIIVIGSFLVFTNMGGTNSVSGYEPDVACEDEQEEISNLEEKLAEAEQELEEAKYKLDTANNNISDAKWYAWESYDDMGDALDSLEEVY